MQKYIYIILEKVPLPILLIGCGVVIILVFLLSCFVESLNKKKQVKEYVKLFEDYMQDSFELRTLLSKIKCHYKKKSFIEEAISKALYYLDHSISRDYKGALNIIEDYLKYKPVSMIHKQYIEEQKRMFQKKMEEK